MASPVVMARMEAVVNKRIEADKAILPEVQQGLAPEGQRGHHGRPGDYRRDPGAPPKMTVKIVSPKKPVMPATLATPQAIASSASILTSANGGPDQGGVSSSNLGRSSTACSTRGV